MCTTCGHCVAVCPLFIDPVSAVVDLRRYVTLTTGDVPGSVGEALTQMERRGNPWGIEKSQRAPWVSELGVRVLQPGEETDVLLFVGCAYAYDARSQKAGRELATCSSAPGSTSPSWGRPKAAAARPPGGSAMSTSSRRWPARIWRRSPA